MWLSRREKVESSIHLEVARPVFTWNDGVQMIIVQSSDAERSSQGSHPDRIVVHFELKVGSRTTEALDAQIGQSRYQARLIWLLCGKDTILTS